MMFLKQGYTNFKGYLHDFEQIPSEDRIPLKTISAAEFDAL